jgi:hypothetical protein
MASTSDPQVGLIAEAADGLLRLAADQARTTYVRRLYGRDLGDAGLYHMVIESTAMPVDACVDMIVVAALRCWHDLRDRHARRVRLASAPWEQL